MTSGKSIYKGLSWALTPKAQELLAQLTTSGMDYDLAFSVLDKLVIDGELPETEVFELPEKIDKGFK